MLGSFRVKSIHTLIWADDTSPRVPPLRDKALVASRIPHIHRCIVRGPLRGGGLEGWLEVVLGVKPAVELDDLVQGFGFRDAVLGFGV